jgi:uncharacterized membrane protein YkvA (DUF1232 family)
MQRHEWLTQELMSLSWYAHYLLEAISDESLSAACRSQAVAAGKYLCEWEDLVPDTDPVFGYVDDLFVVLIGLEQLMRIGGREVMGTYGAKPMPGNIPLEQKLKEAKENFASFWAYVFKEVSAGFQDIQRAMRKDENIVPQLQMMLKNYIQAASTRPVNPIDANALETFLRQRDTRTKTGAFRVQRGG